MAAARGQWGNRATDDVRHMRNRRGWMPYHIAMHKGYEHLAELLHPDIPYTFIFSNDDMEPGSVRMFGPARLMVIAAKALQHKLVDELTAVEQEVGEPAAAPTAAAPGSVSLLAAGPAAAAPEGDIDADATAAEAGEAGTLDAALSSPAVIGAPVGGGTAAAAAPEAAASLPSALVSPFAAKSRRGWTQSSFSVPSEPSTSAATSTAPPPAGPSAAASPAQSLQTGSKGAAVAATAAAAAVAAAESVSVSGHSTQQTEHSFSDLREVVAAGSGSEGAVKHSNSHSSFTGFATAAQQQQQQQHDAASESDAGISTSTVPGSASAVAGSAPGSVGFGHISLDSSSHKLPQSTLLSSGGQVVLAAPADNNAAGTINCNVLAADTTGVQQQQQQQAVDSRLQQQQQQVSTHRRHRRVQSAVAGSYHRTPSRVGPSDTAGAAVRGSDDQQQQSKYAWSRMESLKRRNSRKEAFDMLPPSAVKTSEADDDADAAVKESNRSSINGRQVPAGSTTAAAVRRISSLPANVSSRTAATAAEQEPDLPLHRPSAEARNPVHENPLNVVLAARAQQIGDNPEAIRQQLLAMKLASGALQFNNQISTMTMSLAGSSERAASRFASFTSALPHSSRNSISSRTAAAGAGGGAVSVAEAAAAVAAAAAPRQDACSSVNDADASPFAAAGQQQPGTPTPPIPESGSPSGTPTQQGAQLSPSPSLFNVTAAAVITQQPSQSLHRLLSGNLRTRRSTAAATWQAGGLSSSPSSAPPPAAAAAGGVSSEGAGSVFSSPGPAIATGTLANGELPIVQQAVTGAAAAMISEDDGVDEDGTCEICFDAEAVVALQQCGHTLCVGCCKELCKLHHFKPGLCPYCRQIICGFSRATCVFIP